MPAATPPSMRSSPLAAQRPAAVGAGGVDRVRACLDHPPAARGTTSGMSLTRPRAPTPTLRVPPDGNGSRGARSFRTSIPCSTPVPGASPAPATAAGAGARPPDTDVGLERSGTWGTVPPHGWRHDGRGPPWLVARAADRGPAPPQPRGPAPRRGCRRPLPADGDRRHRRADRPRALRAGERLRSRRLRARLAPPAPGGRVGEHRQPRRSGTCAASRSRSASSRRSPSRSSSPRCSTRDGSARWPGRSS